MVAPMTLKTATRLCRVQGSDGMPTTEFGMNLTRKSVISSTSADFSEYSSNPPVAIKIVSGFPHESSRAADIRTCPPRYSPSFTSGNTLLSSAFEGPGKMMKSYLPKRFGDFCGGVGGTDANRFGRYDFIIIPGPSKA